MVRRSANDSNRLGHPVRLGVFLTRSSLALALAALVALSLACGDSGSGSGTSTSTSSTGGVSVFITDAPNPDFDSIWLTVSRVELLGAGSPVVLFEGETVFDLLRLRFASELFSIKNGITPGLYTKVRLQLDDVELVWHDDRGALQTDHPKLSGNGKLDLTPRGQIMVSAGQMVVLEIDVDAKNSIHIHQTGNDKFQFRSVVFVDVIDAARKDRLARVHGVIDAIDAANRTIDLCELTSPIVTYGSSAAAATVVSNAGYTTPAAKAKKDKKAKKAKKGKKAKKAKQESSAATVIADVGMPEIGDCIELAVLDDADLFDERSGPIDFADLELGDSLLAVGQRRSNGKTLQILTQLIIRAQPGSLVLFDGTITDPPDSSGEFEVKAMLSDFGRSERIDVQLTRDTKILDRSGEEVGRNALFIGQTVEVVGTPQSWQGNSKRQVEADIVRVRARPPGPGPGPNPGPGTPTEVNGQIESVDDAAEEFQVLTDEGEVCVAVDDSTQLELFVCSVAGCVGETADFGAVQPGQQVVAVGTQSGNECVAADSVVLFEDVP